MFVVSRTSSFARSAWERTTPTLRVPCATKRSWSDRASRSHAEHGNTEQSSLLAPRSSRLGISLTEVLIAMGIMTVGLLGVASVFPVGGWYMQKAEIADTASSIANSAMNDLVAQGILDANSWFSLTPSAGTDINDPSYSFAGIDGKYVPHAVGSIAPIPNSFTRPVAETIAAAHRRGITPALSSAMLGQVYVIDPMGCAAITPPGQPSSVNNRYMYGFPASSILMFPGSAYYYNTPLWKTWITTVAAGKPKSLTWPIRRVTFRQGNTGYHIEPAVAEHLCTWQEQLATDLPERPDRPAIATWDTATDGSPLARKFTGDYSWIATVAADTITKRDAIASSPNSCELNVSIVVFHKRVLPTPADINGNDITRALQSERSVGAKIISTGLNGGELLLWDGGDSTTSAFTDLKAGQWIMLCGPHPNTSDSSPRFAMNWYRVLSISNEKNDILTDPVKQRLVAVRGPQWPWQPRTSYAPSEQSSDVARLSDDLCVGIFKGAVDVHSKTIRLENSAANGIPAVGVSGKVGVDAKQGNKLQ